VTGAATPAPGLLVSRYPFSSGYHGKETTGSPKFPSYPCEHMPRSQTPVVPQGHRHNAPKTAAFRHKQTVGFPPLASQRGYPIDHNYAISGLNHAACTLAPSGFAHPITGIARGLHYRPAPWDRIAARAALGREFPNHALFRYVRRVPSSTMAHVSTSPPCHPGRSDFPSPVGDPDSPRWAFPIDAEA
jgi:hypothetical protein